MDFLASVVQIVICSVPIAVFGAWVSSRGTGMRGLVSPWRADPWPVGVQEEDPDAPWGHGRRSPIAPTLDAATASLAIQDLPVDDHDVTKPEVARLHGSVHRPH